MNLDTWISYKVSIFHLNRISSISAMICIMRYPLCQITRMSPVHYSTSLSLVYLSIALPAHSFFQNAPHSKTLLSQHSHNFQTLTLNGLKFLVRHSRSSVLFDCPKHHLRLWIPALGKFVLFIELGVDRRVVVLKVTSKTLSFERSSEYVLVHAIGFFEV